MNRRWSRWLWLLSTFLLVSVCGCEAEGTPAEPTESEAAFWESLPRPVDAEAVEVGEGFDRGFATSMIEPQLFDFYTEWLREQDWLQQAPTEAMITLPRQVWRKDGTELLIELHGLDEQGRTVVWFQMGE